MHRHVLLLLLEDAASRCNSRYVAVNRDTVCLLRAELLVHQTTFVREKCSHDRIRRRAYYFDLFKPNREIGRETENADYVNLKVLEWVNMEGNQLMKLMARPTLAGTKDDIEKPRPRSLG